MKPAPMKISTEMSRTHGFVRASWLITSAVIAREESASSGPSKAAPGEE